MHKIVQCLEESTHTIKQAKGDAYTNLHSVGIFIYQTSKTTNDDAKVIKCFRVMVAHLDTDL